MRFTASQLALLCTFTSVLASPMPEPQSTEPNAVVPAAKTTSFTGKKGKDGTIVAEPAPEDPDSQALQRRQALAVAIGIAATSGASILTKIAIEIGAETISNLGKWNKAREEFTKTTTNEMWARNQDYDKFPATVCYNKGYRLEDPDNIDGLGSAKLELGLLETDYDCMYLGAPNAFFTNSEGGFINLSYTYNPDRCTFDQSTGDLRCT